MRALDSDAITVDPAVQIHRQSTLLDLSRRARQAQNARELGFLLVNESLRLAHYRQAVLWLSEEGAYTLSGVVQPEANAPYVLWVEKVCRHLADESPSATRTLTARDLPAALAAEWEDWWPAHALWVPMPAVTGAKAIGASATPSASVLLLKDDSWAPDVHAWLWEWAQTWWHAFHALHHPKIRFWRAVWQRLKSLGAAQPQVPWWKQNRIRWAAAALAIALCPVRLTVLAPGELVPSNPAMVRAPLEGVVDTFLVQPNQPVTKDQPLFSFDEALIKSRLEVAAQSLATAETEYRQTTQQALADPKFRSQLAILIGKIEEKRAEVDFLSDQLKRSQVLAPQDGIVLFDDPSEWIGRPVNIGERIMRIADASKTEVEAWLPLSDAITLEAGAAVTLYLNASPLSPVSAKVRYMAHDAVERPDGSFAYRVRATLEGATSHRVGLKGTAKLHGGWVPLSYWMLRRPLAAIRTAMGL